MRVLLAKSKAKKLASSFGTTSNEISFGTSVSTEVIIVPSTKSVDVKPWRS